MGCYYYPYKGVGGQEDSTWEGRKKLKTDSELLLIKAAEDAKNAHTYAIEGKIIMEEHKKKPTEINKLEDNKVFTRKVQGAVVNIFF